MQDEGVTKLRFFKMIPDEIFFGREKEIAQIHQMFGDIEKGWMKSTYLNGQKGVGKSEILKKIYQQLFWKQTKVIPFYYVINDNHLQIYNFSKHFLFEFLRQYIAFHKKDPALVINETISFEKIMKNAWELNNPKINNIIENFLDLEKTDDYLKLAYNSISSPHQICSGDDTRVLVIIDEFQKLANIHLDSQKINIYNLFQSVVDSSLAPHLITGSPKNVAKKLSNNEQFWNSLDEISIEPLNSKDAVSMFENLCAYYGISFRQKYSEGIVNQLHRIPFYINSIVRSAKFSKKELDTLKTFQEIYFSEITKGQIYNYWSTYINFYFDDFRVRKTALEILNHCLKNKTITAEEILERIFKNKQEVNKALTILDKTGLISVEFNKIRYLNDPVFRDYLVTQYETELTGKNITDFQNELIRERLKSITNFYEFCGQKQNRENIDDFLKTWNCQMVPAILFNIVEFQQKYRDESLTNILSEVKKENLKLSLPQITGTYEISNTEKTPSPFEIDILGFGFEGGIYTDDKEMIVFLKVIFNRGVLDDDIIDEYEQKCNSIKIENIPAKDRRKKWIITNGIFSDKAKQKINDYGIWTSNFVQFNTLCKFIGLEEPFNMMEKSVVMAPLRPEETKNDLEFEMTIPIVSETELVAARAVEQIALNMDFDEESTSKIKMALIEACLNAFEHSNSRDNKVHLKFVVQQEKLLIIVQDYGKKFDPNKVEKPVIEKKLKSINKRGWGLVLMKELMDEVIFEGAQEGTKLKLVKYFNKKGEL